MTAAVEGVSLLSVVFLPLPIGRAELNHELLPIPPVFGDCSVVVVGELVLPVMSLVVDLPVREEECLSLSESTRGSALLAKSEA